MNESANEQGTDREISLQPPLSPLDAAAAVHALGVLIIQCAEAKLPNAVARYYAAKRAIADLLSGKPATMDREQFEKSKRIMGRPESYWLNP